MQADKLGHDVIVTRQKYLAELVSTRFPAREQVPLTIIHEESNGRGLNWITYVPKGKKKPVAIALYTDAVSRVQDCIYIVEWHWCPIEEGRN